MKKKKKNKKKKNKKKKMMMMNNLYFPEPCSEGGKSGAVSGVWAHGAEFLKQHLQQLSLCRVE